MRGSALKEVEACLGLPADFDGPRLTAHSCFQPWRDRSCNRENYTLGSGRNDSRCQPRPTEPVSPPTALSPGVGKTPACENPSIPRIEPSRTWQEDLDDDQSSGKQVPTQKHIEFQLSAHSQPFNRSGRPPPTVQRDKEKEQGLTHDEVALCPSAPRPPGRVQAPHKEFTVPRIFFQASLCFSTGRVAFAEPRRSWSHTTQRFVRHLRAFQTGHESHTETNPTRSSRSHDHAPRRQTSAALAGTTVQQKNATSVLFNTGTTDIHPKMTPTLRSAMF